MMDSLQLRDNYTWYFLYSYNGYTFQSPHSLPTIIVYVHLRLTDVPILVAAFHMLRCIVIVWEIRLANQVSKSGE